MYLVERRFGMNVHDKVVFDERPRSAVRRRLLCERDSCEDGGLDHGFRAGCGVRKRSHFSSSTTAKVTTPIAPM